MSDFDDEFYGFPEIPFHIHLGMTFARPEPGGPAVVTIPASPSVVGSDGRQSLCAVYTVAEVSSGIAMCDGLLLRDVADSAPDMRPLALTRECSFRPGQPAFGAIRSETWFASDAEQAGQQLVKRRKVKVETGARVYGEDGTLAGEMRAQFYVRLMELSRLEAMAGALTPTLAGDAAGS